MESKKKYSYKDFEHFQTFDSHPVWNPVCEICENKAAGFFKIKGYAILFLCDGHGKIIKYNNPLLEPFLKLLTACH